MRSVAELRADMRHDWSNASHCLSGILIHIHQKCTQISLHVSLNWTDTLPVTSLGHYFLAGGNVSGSQIFGSYPHKLKEDESDVNFGRGRVLPTTSWEGVWLGLAQWMGVPSSDMDRVLPNLKNFPERMLLNQSALFDVNMVEEISPEKDSTTTTTTTSTSSSASTSTAPLSSNDKCPKTCSGHTCDDWTTESEFLCKTLEQEYKCDCSGCACKLDKMLSACHDYSYKGDGNCDDDNNNADCDYDGGDCCEKSLGGPVKQDYCKECKCLQFWEPARP